MMTKTIYREIDIDIDLSDFSDEELLEELRNRGIVNIDSVTENLEEIYQKKRLNKNYEKDLDKLIYKILGRIT